MPFKLKDTLLLVGNENSDRHNLHEIFKPYYNLLEAENLLQGALLLEQNAACIAAVLVDAETAEYNAINQFNLSAHKDSDNNIPVLFLASPSDNDEHEALILSAGANDVVTKPYTAAGIRNRVQTFADLNMHKTQLKTLINKQSETIRSTNQIMMDALSAIIEHRSTESGNHVLRIRRFTKILLEDVASTYPEYGLTENIIDIITSAAALHDIGKISIPDDILNKPGKLTTEEFEIMKTHTTVGSELIQHLSGMGDPEFLRYAYNIALYHHERYDGNGYPFGLCGEDIPICAHVVGIADAFDALTTPRVYKEAFPYEQAFNMILNGECGTFSPKILECLKNIRADFVALAGQYADGYSPKDDSITVPLTDTVKQTAALNTSQLSYVKYQTILHYLNDTVMELDLEQGLYHTVYNPNPDFDSLHSYASFTDAADLLELVPIHPDDKGVIEEIRTLFANEFFRLNNHYKSFTCRIFSALSGAWQNYELIFLRVNTEVDAQHLVLLVLHRMNNTSEKQSYLRQNDLHSSPAFQGLISTALRCRCDNELTIDAGTEELFTLTGFIQDDVAQDFDNKLLRIIVPEDRDILLKAIEEHRKTGEQLVCEFRIMRKNTTPIWALSKSRIYIEDGQEYFYIAIRDNSHGKAIEHDLKSMFERYSLVIDTLDDIIFEWDLVTDTMYCSPKWKEHFGYMPVSNNYASQFGIATHFHPDDLPLIRNAIEKVKNDQESIRIDVRIANSDAKYLWTRIIATAYMNEHNVLTRIVGILHDIDTVKRAEQSLREKAEQDSLTKLLNKASSQQLITEYLAKRKDADLGALIFLDLDNFKLINDNFGHLYGDTVLTKVAETLKKLFRNQDIIGRIGGDEFLVLMCDIPNKELVHNRCRMMLNTFRELFEELAPNMNVSCSIGVALIPEHGIDYANLFRKADEALYISKNNGKNTFFVYNPDSTTSFLPDATRISTRIDSEEHTDITNASFINAIFQQLYESNNIVKTINDIMSNIGTQFNVSRVYIFENNSDNTTCSNTFEWCNQGILPEIDNLQNLNYEEDIAGWKELYNEYGVLYCTDISKLDGHLRAILEVQGIKSILQCAIMDNGVFRGYVGFDDCVINRIWTQDQIDILQLLSKILSMFLLKKRSEDKNNELTSSLQNIIDNQDCWLYIIDPQTFQIKFLNQKLLSAGYTTGKTCYQVFLNKKSPCANCPITAPNNSCIIKNHKLGKLVRAQATKLIWNGKPELLITCYNLE